MRVLWPYSESLSAEFLIVLAEHGQNRKPSAASVFEAVYGGHEGEIST